MLRSGAERLPIVRNKQVFRVALLSFVTLVVAALVSAPLYQRSPSHPQPAPAHGDREPSRTRITLCTQVLNEIPYLLEWIVFYQMQGVQRVAICDDGSSDGTIDDLPELLRSRGVDGVIIEPAPAARNGTDGQLACYNQFMERYRRETDWFIVADVDEYMFARKFRRLADYLDSLPTDVGQVAALELRFGCQGRKERLPNGMRRDATTGRLTYHDGSGKVRLVTQESTRRGLSQGLDEPEFPVREALFPNCSFQAPCNGWTICNNFRGKAITRARNVIEMYHHRNRIQDTALDIEASGMDLAVHHYSVRSLEDAAIKEQVWNKCDPTAIWHGADEYQSTFLDPSMLAYHEELNERLSVFSQ